VTRNNRILIGVAAAAAVFAVYWFLILAPKRAEAVELQTQIDAKAAAVQQAEATVASYAAARASYNTNYATLVGLGKAVPGDDDVRSLMVQLSDAAKRAGVNFRDIEVSAGSGAPTQAGIGVAGPPGAVPVGSGGIFAMPFNFKFTGRFANLSTLLAAVEHYVTIQEDNVRVTGRLMRVESIDLNPSGAGYPDIEVTIKATSYTAQAATPVGGTPPAGSTATPATAPAGGTSTPPTTTATATGAIR
jgi:hypothetical protein